MKQIARYLLVISFAAMLVMPGVSSAQSVGDLQAQIQALLAQVKQLQAQLAQQQGGGTAAWCHTFNANLKFGDQGTEVAALQTALTKEDLNVAGGDNALFEEITASRVTGFQEKYHNEILAPSGLQNGTGYVGARTRAKLNALYGCGVAQPPPPPAPVPPLITVLSPNGGEQWAVGNTQTIRWSAPSSIAMVNIGLSNYLSCWSATPACLAPGVITTITSNIPNTGSYNWTIPANLAGQYKVTVYPLAYQLSSQYNISISGESS